jgi:hypothetical protein
MPIEDVVDKQDFFTKHPFKIRFPNIVEAEWDYYQRVVVNKEYPTYHIVKPSCLKEWYGVKN